MKKVTSSNTLNEQVINKKCSMAYTLSIIGGRWKPTILWNLLNGKMRYGELRKRIPEVSERVLITQLRELEDDNTVKRIVYAEVPPRVEYELTPLGLSMRAFLLQLEQWGDEHK